MSSRPCGLADRAMYILVAGASQQEPIPGPMLDVFPNTLDVDFTTLDPGMTIGSSCEGPCIFSIVYLFGSEDAAKVKSYEPRSSSKPYSCTRGLNGGVMKP